MSWQKQGQCWTSESCYSEAGEREREREAVYVALQYAASFHCLVEEWKDCEEKWRFVDKRKERMKHRTEWCAEAHRYRCMRCGKGSKYMDMSGRCDGPKFFSKIGKMVKASFWRS